LFACLFTFVEPSRPIICSNEETTCCATGGDMAVAYLCACDRCLSADTMSCDAAMYPPAAPNDFVN
jgi:hypothetical protein